MARTSGVTDPPRTRRTYDNTLRQERAAATRRRIVEAGSELLHSSDVRDWEALTVRAVAERAGVNERTVYRHFDNERGLRDAVMHELQKEAGVDLEGMRLGDVGALATRIFRHAASFRLEARPALDPTLRDTRRRLHDALLGAVADAAPGWSEEQRTLAAAVLDVLSSVGAYERLVRDWELDGAEAARAVGWAIAQLELAIRRGGPPAPR
ncbi:MAG TPA: helix-turn-helix domain-containing protein [Acidimicrobiales bacterium]|nr:helix-turn-helix domain-containing protein [Acidimicrobiales bacterium]